jgi:hypothetical protein
MGPTGAAMARPMTMPFSSIDNTNGAGSSVL